MEESALREISRDWVLREYAHERFVIRPMVFHDEHVSLSDWIRTHFRGKELAAIPKYQSLEIEPDIIALVRRDMVPNTWVMGECKVDVVGVGDYRQALNYPNVANASAGYLFFEGKLAQPVLRLIEQGESTFQGTNTQGRITSKRLMILGFSDGRFRKVL